MVVVGGKKLETDDFEKVIFEGAQVALADKALAKVQTAFEFLSKYARDKIIYGINTGLGPMAQIKISEEDQHQLQINLIRSHCSGSGNPLSVQLSKATMLARLNTLMVGASGVHTDSVEILRDLLNKNIAAQIFERGGVGASGDLVQLAHLALNLIGEGEVLVDGKIEDTQSVFNAHGIKPLEVRMREGLSLMNGTSAMTGIGMINIIQAKKLLYWSVALSAITNEIMKSFDDHFSKELNEVKHHPGQMEVAKMMRDFLSDSKLIRKRADHLYHRKIEEAVFTDKVQEYYSLRCVPQILGPVLDTMKNVEQVLLDELNSVSDNPVIDLAGGTIHHGGNFHGDYVALEMDKLKIVITKVSMLAERQLNYLLNDKLNQKLPPFINLGKLGLNFGMQGLQFTATSSTAENQTLSFPMYLHSISNNNDNQDIVSMGCNASLITQRVIDNAFVVLAIQSIALLQAIDYLDCQNRLSTFSSGLYTKMRALVPTFIEDAPKYESIQLLKEFLFKGKAPKF